ncbi:ThiF family adenylyltransferase [Nonomuraea sp. NPDC050643]|uniref:ThiF family adenylyltransferase n=1 Tax=Nonomuraea sp. NPDC050643 TaxID=3155660 RepID=UPI0033D44960
MRIVLKECAWEPLGGELLVLTDPREVIRLRDQDGQVGALLTALDEGPGTVAGLRDRLAAAGVELDEDAVRAAIEGLDALGLVECESDLTLGDPALDARHASTLAFFGPYATLDRPRADFVNQLRRSHVLVAGVGATGSSLVQCLAGLGVGRLTLVDRGEVEPGDFAGQFLYRHADIGASKAERAAAWVRAYDPCAEVRPVDRWISGPDDLKDLLDDVDLVAGGLDGHPEAHLWVNEAAVRAGLPLVVGGATRSEITYCSVDPGRTPCVQCDENNHPAGAGGFAERARGRLTARTALIGPPALQIGSLIAYEALRYLTRFEEPRAAGALITLDPSNGMVQEHRPFTPDPGCPVCPR